MSLLHTLSVIFSLCFPLFYFPLSFSHSSSSYTHTLFQFPLYFSHSLSFCTHTPFLFLFPLSSVHTRHRILQGRQIGQKRPDRPARQGRPAVRPVRSRAPHPCVRSLRDIQQHCNRDRCAYLILCHAMM